MMKMDTKIKQKRTEDAAADDELSFREDTFFWLLE